MGTELVWLARHFQQKLKVSEDVVEWLEGRNDAIKETMRKFPPSCSVVLLGNLECGHKKGEIGIVRSFYEDGELGVAFGPDEVRHKISGLLVRLQRCLEPFTVEFIAEAFGKKGDD